MATGFSATRKGKNYLLSSSSFVPDASVKDDHCHIPILFHDVLSVAGIDSLPALVHVVSLSLSMWEEQENDFHSNPEKRDRKECRSLDEGRSELLTTQRTYRGMVTGRRVRRMDYRQREFIACASICLFPRKSGWRIGEIHQDLTLDYRPFCAECTSSWDQRK